MSSGERPIGAAKGKQSDTEALCQTPPRTSPTASRHSPTAPHHPSRPNLIGPRLESAFGQRLKRGPTHRFTAAAQALIVQGLALQSPPV